MATQNAINGKSGTVINEVRITSFSPTSTTVGNSSVYAPATSSMVQLTSLTIAPENSNNVLIFNFYGSFCQNTGGSILLSLFQGSSLLYSGVYGGISPTQQYTPLLLTYQQAAGTTSSTTYYIYYCGINTTPTQPLYVNQDINGYTLGNSLSYTFIITEEIA